MKKKEKLKTKIHFENKFKILQIHSVITQLWKLIFTKFTFNNASKLFVVKQ